MPRINISTLSTEELEGLEAVKPIRRARRPRSCDLPEEVREMAVASWEDAEMSAEIAKADALVALAEALHSRAIVAVDLAQEQRAGEPWDVDPCPEPLEWPEDYDEWLDHVQHAQDVRLGGL